MDGYCKDGGASGGHRWAIDNGTGITEVEKNIDLGTGNSYLSPTRRRFPQHCRREPLRRPTNRDPNAMDIDVTPPGKEEKMSKESPPGLKGEERRNEMVERTSNVANKATKRRNAPAEKASGEADVGRLWQADRDRTVGVRTEEQENQNNEQGTEGGNAPRRWTAWRPHLPCSSVLIIPRELGVLAGRSMY